MIKDELEIIMCRVGAVPDEGKLGYLMGSIETLLRIYEDTIEKRPLLTEKIIDVLKTHPEGLRCPQIAEMQRSSYQNIQRSLNKLIKMGKITRNEEKVYFLKNKNEEHSDNTS